MQPHQERVVNERAELAEKTGRLRDFLFGATVRAVDPEEQSRLVRQHAYMKAYLEVLDERIASFQREQLGSAEE